MDRVVINQKRSSQLLLLLGSVALVAGCGWIWIVYNSIFYRIIAVIGILFFGFGCYFFIKGMIHPSPVLIIDETGITDHSTASSAGHISWEDILYIRKNETSVVTHGHKATGKYISVVVKDIDKYMKKASPMVVKIMSANIALGYDPINISLYTADKKLPEVLAILERYFAKYGNK